MQYKNQHIDIANLLVLQIICHARFISPLPTDKSAPNFNAGHFFKEIEITFILYHKAMIPLIYFLARSIASRTLSGVSGNLKNSTPPTASATALTIAIPAEAREHSPTSLAP